MTLSRNLMSFMLLLVLGMPLFGQQSLPEVEKELSQMAEEILLNDSLNFKIEQNRSFARLLISTLKRSESYHYPWDSLPTVSVLRSDDDVFRIFTWHIVDKNYRQFRGEQYHYYFGLVQREIINSDGSKEYVVIPLLDQAPISAGVENMQLDNQHWLGALYYPLRGHGKIIPSYTSKSQTITTQGDSVYVLGEGWVTGDMKKKVRKTTYYLLAGWNGGDNEVNYKMAEALYFDPNDVEKVNFGAGIFYFDQYTPRMRALFRYQENAPFSLNMGFSKGKGLFGSAEEMLLYDHMGIPNFKEGTPVSIYQAGPDGSYDGFKFDKRLGGFRWFKDVELTDKIDRDRATQIANNQEEIIRGRLDQLRYWAELIGDEDVIKQIEKLQAKDKLTARTVRMLKRQESALADQLESRSKVEQDRLRNAGIRP